ncbi:hypothetical protein TanjilG_10470 [Lupinus angustifolius]|uniref:Major facilitator superfamily (MFS) profile domain-containing protein n=2 Tax=Lupinus angustifolius TaxID=3871 RepID=A0A4P1R4J8_LUPAN|nr:hypothetical protein TanjilG_10470 [Lupinus angustifolius]
MVTNFMGSSYILTIVGGFICDSYLTRFTTFILSGAIELMGFILLAYQAQHSHLRPPENTRPSPVAAAILHIGLYCVAIGVAGVKAALQTHGADQVDDKKQKNLISSFFNWYFFSICSGALLASTIMVWIEENCGWSLSFMICAIVFTFAICIFVAGFPIYRNKRPAGSPLTRMIKVFVAAAKNTRASPSVNVNHNATTQPHAREQSHDKLKFLNKALIDAAIDVTMVDETKSFLSLLPIFATTIMMNCCMAQLLTFSVQQGNIMNRKIHNFIIPTQSLSVFALAIILSFIPIFEQFRHIYRHKDTMQSKTFQPLSRVGFGLVLGIMSMAVAAIVEAKRKQELIMNDITISVFWLVLQYILVSVADTLVMSGMLEFFYSEAHESMRSMCAALSWCSSAMGFFISSVLVAITNSASGKFGKEWLGGKDLNHDRLDLFYALICILNIVNFMFYVYFAKKY